jgi:peptidoglycan/xylan/chitin deacetylase (PgdA/CDA1 family)
MQNIRYTLFRAAFEALALSRITWVLRRLSRARGLIFTLHRVLPEAPADFSPNAILQVTPTFLEQMIGRVRQLGYEIVPIDEGLRRVASDAPERPFIVLTFDDAYRDNLVYAWPVLSRLQAPFTLYVPTALVDGVGEVWWQALEDIVASQNAMAITHHGETEYLPSATLGEKQVAYAALYRRMRAMPEMDRVDLIRGLAEQYRLDLARHTRSLIMDWPEVRKLAGSPLCTIGAHTVHHYELSKLEPEQARQEIAQSMAILKAQFGSAPAHLSYPIGSRVAASDREYGIARQSGLASAVTTRPGALHARHRHGMFALPRISLNGLFQARRYIDVLATPAVFDLLPG